MNVVVLAYALGASATSTPVANFTHTTNLQTVSFTDTSTDSGGKIVSRLWNFGDGATSTLTNPTHTYANGGTYSVTLRATDDQGVSDAKTESLTVASVINASFTFKSTEQDAKFINTSTDTGSSIVLYAWSFGDGTTSTVANPAHTYGASGAYTVTLTVTDKLDRTSTISHPVTITLTPPIASFSFTSQFLTTTFHSLSKATNGYIAQWFWNVGDGGYSFANNPAHTFPSAGTYNVSLTVYDSHITSHLWSFGDGTTSTATNPTHTYAAAGAYIVSLTVTDNLAHTATNKHTVTVH